MKILCALLSLILVTSACSKGDNLAKPPTPEPAPQFPEMLVTELNDVKIGYQQSHRLDIDHNGSDDFFFATWLIGNPNEVEDELLFFAASGTSSALMVGGNNDSPRFNRNDVIPVDPIQGHDWFVVSLVELALKNTGVSGIPYWEKDWKSVTHKYLAVRVVRNEQVYYGWVELSMDTVNSTLILHRAAISKTPAKAVKAGL